MLSFLVTFPDVSSFSSFRANHWKLNIGPGLSLSAEKVAYEKEIISPSNVSNRYSSIGKNDLDSLILAFEPQNEHTYVTPQAIHNASADEIWEWWQQRKISEAVLKSSIASNVVSTNNHTLYFYFTFSKFI